MTSSQFQEWVGRFPEPDKTTVREMIKKWEGIEEGYQKALVGQADRLEELMWVNKEFLKLLSEILDDPDSLTSGEERYRRKIKHITKVMERTRKGRQS